jgi:hypothetical protein
MEIQRKELKGLARLLGTLSLWMALGFALFPTLFEKVYTAAGEVKDITEVELYAMVMAPTCLVIGIILLVYGFVNRNTTHGEPNPEKVIAKDQ